ncbi:MAG: hypothetical protein ACKOUR_17365 [Planctomycetota bacterium]
MNPTPANSGDAPPRDRSQDVVSPAAMVERRLRWLLRFEALVLISAAVAVILPGSWMVEIHRLLGMGELPRSPLVEYLTRSLSGLYALWGPVYWHLASEVSRQKRLIRLLAWLKILFGVVLMAIDVAVGMPLFWLICEGPVVIGLSALTLAWLRPLKLQ